MKSIFKKLGFPALTLCVAPALAQNYDIVLKGGRVMDPETNLDAVRNVGIRGGKIAAVTKSDIKGNETIDRSGSNGFKQVLRRPVEIATQSGR